MRQHHDLAGLDLNLVVALDALLRERHVTRAADSLGISQSAASHSLAKLRDLLGDPLLVRGPRGTMIATARAEALGPAIGAALGALSDALRPPEFEPKSARRTFRIDAADYAELVILPKLVERFERDAPNLDLWVHSYAGEGDDALAGGDLDVVIGPPRGAVRPSGSYEKLLFEETFTCVVRSGHPLARGKLTLARYCEAAHVMVAPRGTPGSFVDDALAAIGRSRRVAVAVPHFLIVPHLLVATDLIATLADRLVSIVAAPFELARLPLPIPITGFAIAMAWHERDHHDPAHRWLRDQVVAVTTGRPARR